MRLDHSVAWIALVVIGIGLLVIGPNAIAMAADESEGIEAASNGTLTINGSLNVNLPGGTTETPTGPPQLDPSLSGPPTDVDSDGLYEDLNGNNRADFDDVVLFFTYIRDSAITDNVDAYDYNQNGRIDFADIVVLFRNV